MKDILKKAVEEASGQTDFDIEFPDKNFGDLSSNVAMKMEGNPRENAERIVKKLEKDEILKKIFSRIEIKGSGFINFYLSDKSLLGNLKDIIAQKGNYGSSKTGEGKTVVIDYSSPNIAKAFSIGHLRSTIIGQALYNLFTFSGYKAIGDNHLGDWGTQFGSLLYQIDSKGLKADDLTIDTLEKLYVEFNSEAEKDEKLWEKARSWFKKLEEKDPKAKKIWKVLVDISVKEFDKIYKLLGVKIDHSYGESFYEDKMPQVIDLLKKKRLLKKSRGAMVVELKDMPPAMVVKSDGATTYLTRDLATIKFRIDQWDPKVIVYEVGSEQSLHFRQVFGVAKLLGWTKGRKFVHVGHGLIRFEHGKMSTRRGQTVKLEGVLKESVKRAEKMIENSETGRGFAKKEKEETAQKVGIGAIKYFDLSHNPQSDIVFDWEKLFMLEGNSATYLQYTYARAKSVLKKSGKSTFLVKNSEVKIGELEKDLMRTFSRFSGITFDATKNYSPNLLANYLFDLAQEFNTFYAKEKILGSDNEDVRLAVTFGVSQLLKSGLNLLGIDAPEKM